MAFEVPHKHDISLDGQEMRNQMIENFEAIEQENKELEGKISQLEQIIFGQNPQVVKMADNSTPPVNSGVMLVNLTNKEDK